MRKFSLAVLIFISALVVPSCHADSFAYNNVGKVAPTVSLTAASTGSIVGYFLGADSAGTDLIRLYNVTQNTYSAFGMSNHSALGQSFNFGQANQGDVLVFQIVNYAISVNGTNPILASDPAYSADGINHTYVSDYAGSGVIPAGKYLAFEDYVGGYDLDYNDDTFVATNLATTAATAPEPGTLALLGSGMLAGLGILRRRTRRA